MVPLGSAHERQGDARIAAGRLDDLHTRLEFAGLLGIPDHRRADAALDAVGWFAALDLRQHRASQPLGQTIHPNEWRAANGFGVVVENRHRLNSFDKGLESRSVCAGGKSGSAARIMKESAEIGNGYCSPVTP